MSIDFVGRYPVELLLDILTTGGDYACRGYWGQIEEYKWYWWYELDDKGEPTDTPSKKLTPDTVLWRIRDDEDGMAEEEDRPFVDITLRKLDEATTWALDNYNHMFSWDVVGGKIVDIDYDGYGADVIIQKIVLGEVTYG